MERWSWLPKSTGSMEGGERRRGKKRRSYRDATRSWKLLPLLSFLLLRELDLEISSYFNAHIMYESKRRSKQKLKRKNERNRETQLARSLASKQRGLSHPLPLSLVSLRRIDRPRMLPPYRRRRHRRWEELFGRGGESDSGRLSEREWATVGEGRGERVRVRFGRRRRIKVEELDP